MAPCERPAPGILFPLLPLIGYLFDSPPVNVAEKRMSENNWRGARGSPWKRISAPKVKCDITFMDLISSLYKQIC